MKVRYIIPLIIIACASNSYADNITDKISIGMDKEEVIKIIGDSPSKESCTNIGPASQCTLYWKKGIPFIRETIYTGIFVQNRLINISFDKKHLF